MPRVRVPLLDAACPGEVQIAYEVRGKGPVLVILVPGLCVPRSMYEKLSAALSATPAYTTLAIDNRGIGDSDAPYASLWSSPGYTVKRIAMDAWAVVDHHLQNNSPKTSPPVENGRKDNSALPVFHQKVALVGHSMGGMVVQHMVLQRPQAVACVALLSTHAGGFWNMLPTATMLRGALRLAYNRFDRDINAAINLDFHFTERFLDQMICVPGPNDDELDDNDAAKTTETHTAHSASGRHPHYHLFGDQAQAAAAFMRRRASYIARSIGKRRRRREVYHARYVGEDVATGVVTADTSRSEATKTALTEDVDRASSSGTNPSVSNASSSSLTCNPNDSPNAMMGHAAVVRSHRLSYADSARFAACTKLVKLVMFGRKDRVITPQASRALADAVGATTVVEVEAAHFIVDEAADLVTVIIIDGLNQAFFHESPAPCSCEWCAPPEKSQQSSLHDFRLC